jgi:hypothetical protein
MMMMMMMTTMTPTTNYIVRMPFETPLLTKLVCSFREELEKTIVFITRTGLML